MASLDVMKRTVIAYAIALAAIAVLLQWLDFRYAARDFSLELYLAVLALVFVVLGIWLGVRLTPAPRAAAFEANEKAIAALGLTRRERDVLAGTTRGRSNKEIARDLGISPNTVKSQVASLFAKLGVGRRVQAIEKARALSLIP